MGKAELLELAERVEKLEGPGGEVDALIRCAMFAQKGCYVEQSKFNGAWCVYRSPGKLWEPRGLSPIQRMGEFTASLDAALTLVPEGWNFGAGKDDIVSGPTGWAWVSGARIEYQIVRAATPALALTVAALRARATTLPGEEG